MKRIISFLLSALIFVLSVPFCVSAEGEAWDGTAAEGFAGGSGTESDPFLISNAAEFAYLCEQLDFGNDDFSGKYFELTHNIVFNDETFEFQSDTGLVRISDGENVIYCGTGIPGDTSGDNDLFDTDASQKYRFYTSDVSTEFSYDHEAYGGEIYYLHNLMAMSGFKAFKGNLNGKGYIIKGVMASGNGSLESAEYAGLFRTASDAVFKYIRVEDSFVYRSESGGIAGLAENCTFYSCIFDGIVAGGGGIASEAVNCNFGSCENNGVVIGSGGIVGTNSADGPEYLITDCENRGYVVQGQSYGTCGGIVGNNSVATVSCCKNRGTVVSNADTGVIGTGGIAGRASDCEVSQCVNFGCVSGKEYVGGILGDASEVNVSNCSNRNTVKGEVHVGGIIGILNTITSEAVIENNYNNYAVIGDGAGGIIGWALSHNSLTLTYNMNDGYISGGTSVGGIVGQLTSAKGCTTFSFCSNMNEVISNGRYAGGIVGGINAVDGSVIIEKCYNSANIDGAAYVGGLVGQYAVNEADIEILIKNSYNSGDILGEENVGGFVGNVSRNLGMGTPLDISTSYTVGNITAKGNDTENTSFGIMIGSGNCRINTESCYYSVSSGPENAYGSAGTVIDGATGLPISEMNKEESFIGFDFATIWTMDDDTSDYEYPVLIDLPHENHAHYIYMECDDEFHWDICDCGYMNKEAHYGEWQEWIDGVRYKYCDECKLCIGYEKQYAMLGDINNDGDIDQYDYILAKRIHFKNFTPDDGQKLRGDVDKDGDNDQYDYILIKRHHFKNYTITG